MRVRTSTESPPLMIATSMPLFIKTLSPYPSLTWKWRDQPCPLEPEHPAVGHHPVDVQDQEFDLLKAGLDLGRLQSDEAPMLFIGERVGTRTGPKVDIAVDPLEGTTLCAKTCLDRSP